MQRSGPDSWTLGKRPVRLTGQAFLATWRAMQRAQARGSGLLGTVLMSLVLPCSTLAILALVYRDHPALIGYAVVGQAALAYIFSAIYGVGQLLETERLRGTLVLLVLAPCPRVSWLGGFAMVGIIEASVAAVVMVVFGIVALDVRLDPNLTALALALPLFLAALWGLGVLLSAIGLATRRSNWLATLVSPFILLLGGVYYPIADLPAWLRYPARALPFGYGTQALADATLHHATIAELAPALLPLAGFALALPLVGLTLFQWIERLVRRQGAIDLY